MPIYEYKCGSCGKDFEKLVMPSSPAVCCPGCKSSNINKKMSVCAGHFGASGSSDYDLGGGSSTHSHGGGGCGGCSGGSCGSCGCGG